MFQILKTCLMTKIYSRDGYISMEASQDISPPSTEWVTACMGSQCVCMGILVFIAEDSFVIMGIEWFMDDIVLKRPQVIMKDWKDFNGVLKKDRKNVFNVFKNVFKVEQCVLLVYIKKNTPILCFIASDCDVSMCNFIICPCLCYRVAQRVLVFVKLVGVIMNGNFNKKVHMKNF